MGARPFFDQGVRYYSIASHHLPADVQLSSNSLQARFRLSDSKSSVDNIVDQKAPATIAYRHPHGPARPFYRQQ